MLAEGNIVPAHADVVDAAGLLVDEAALTGESVPGRQDGSRAGRTGRGGGGPHGGGARTRPGRGDGHRGSQLDGAGRRAARCRARAPLQRRLAGVGRVLAMVAVALCAIGLAIGLARAGRPS